MDTKEILLKLRTQSGLTQEMLAARAGADLFGGKPSRSSNTGRKLKNKARRQSVHVLCRLAVLPGFMRKNQPVSPCVSAGSGASSRRLSTGRIAMR